MAIDCWGREILVTRDFEVKLASYKNGNNNGSIPVNLYIVLSYRECETEPVPVFLDECGCGDRSEPNRIRETFNIDVLTGEDFDGNELLEYKRDRIVSAGEVPDVTDHELKEFNGAITVRTLKGEFTKKLNTYGPNAKVAKLIQDINSSAAKVNMKYIDDESKFAIATENDGDIIILGEKGDKPFFSAIKMPAFHTERGYKLIEACPDCSRNTKIILAEIGGYDKVKGDYLDPSKPEFKEPAYTIDNLSHRKTLPRAELLNKLITYLMFK
jgi:hypothetical protein